MINWKSLDLNLQGVSSVFKKIEIDSLNNTLINVITIIGDHVSVILG